MSQKKRANFGTVYLKIIRIDFDDIWQKYSKDSRIVCMFQFSCKFVFLSTFRLSNQTPEITRILTLYQANALTLMRWNFFITHTPKLITIGTHNLQTFKHNTLVNKLLLMQLFLFNIRPKLHCRSIFCLIFPSSITNAFLPPCSSCTA